MHDSLITATAPGTAPSIAKSPSTDQYRIGVLIAESETEIASGQLQSAAERLGHSIFAANDAAELDRSTVDFAIASVNLKQKSNGLPTFGLIREAKIGFWDDDEWLSRVAKFDGYLTISDSVRRFIARFGSQGWAEPLIGFFEFTPERQFLTCQLERLIGGGAFRLCDISISAEPRQEGSTSGLTPRPYLRRYGIAPNEPGGFATRSIGEQSAQRLFAAFGGGLITLQPEQEMDAAVLHRLCEIVSVGAVAICPDIRWIRRYFGDTVWYYPDPAGDPSTSLAVIDGAVEAITSDAASAAAQARAAKSIFDETLAAEVMLRNAVGLFEEWRARNSRAGASAGSKGTVINTDASAIESVFAKLPPKTLATVGRAVAQLNPLQPMPRWRFDSFYASPDLAVHVRHSLWRAAKARGGTGPVIVPWHAGTRLNLYLDNDLSLSLFAGGSFEPNEFALLGRVFQPGMVFVDGGANEGAYTVFAAARVGPSGRVLAIEPSERERERLKANIALNRLGNIDIVEAALTDRTGSARLLIAEPEHAGQNTLGEFTYAINSSGVQEVATTTLDELVEEHGLDRVDILKLDIEGAEFRALSAASRVLEEMRPLILFEITEPALLHQGASSAALFELLKAANYRLLRIDEETGEPVPFVPARDTPSDNMVAVHAERHWGLLPSCDEGDVPMPASNGKGVKAHARRHRGRSKLVLCTGMPRSGSTWSYNVCMSLLKSAYPAAEVIGLYSDQIGEVVATRRADRLVIKCHAADNAGRAAMGRGDCRSVYTFRDPRQAVASFMAFAGASCEAALHSIRNSLEFMTFQRRSGNAVLISYSEIIAKPQQPIRRVANHLGLVIDDAAVIEAERVSSRAEASIVAGNIDTLDPADVYRGDKYVYHRRTLIPRNHFTDCGAQWETMLTTSQIAEIQHETRAWADLFGW